MEIRKPRSTEKCRTIFQSTACAFTGLVDAIREERKIRQVLTAMICVTAACVWADVGYFQILMVIFSWVLCFVCEMFNTALEKAMDLAGGEKYHPLIREGKDYAAACTFVSIVFASCLALFILWDKLFDHGEGISREPVAFAARISSDLSA